MSLVSNFFGNLKLQGNPLKYGDALGLTYGPLSGRAPGKLTDSGLDLQQIANPFVSRKDLHNSNDIAPYVAAAIATFGGSSAAEAAPAAEGGAMDMGGSAGIFDSMGQPLYESPGMETGAFDQYGSQSSPTDSRTIFDDGPQNGSQTPGRQAVTQQLMQRRMPPQSGMKPYQPVGRQQQLLWPQGAISMTPGGTGGY